MLYQMTKEEEDAIMKEIGYSRAQLKKDIPVLRLWLKEQSHLPPSRLTESDIFLSNYLVGCKGSIETAKRKLDHYYSLRGKGEIFLDRDNLQYVENSSKHSALFFLPTMTPDSCEIFMGILIDKNVDVYNGVEALKHTLLVFEHRLRNGGGIAGQAYVVLDASKYTISHFMRLPPMAIRSFVSFIQDAYPWRIRRILVTSAPSVLASAINNLILPLLSKKLRERIRITSEPLEKVFEHTELLPGDYNGEKQKSIKELSNGWKVELRSLKDILPQLQEETDEEKRPKMENGKSDPYFGLHGSIKTLVLD